jgi:RNA polymerase sigma-70 factor (ECF subfamily)
MPENEMTGDMFLFARGDSQTAAVPRQITPAARLVELIRSGDQDAFGELYRVFAPMVHGIILARVPRDEVDDIVQDVFISAFKNLGSLREDAAVGGWLAMIARNRAAEFFRTTRHTEELTDGPGGNDDSLARAREILAAIRSCPEAYKETLCCGWLKE